MAYYKLTNQIIAYHKLTNQIMAYYKLTDHRWNYAMVTGDEDLIIINNTFSHMQLHTQQVMLLPI